MMTILSFSFQLAILSLTLIGTVELLALTLAGLFHKKTLLDRSINKDLLPKLIVVMPAHNEEIGIADSF